MKPTVTVSVSGSAVQMHLHAARFWGKHDAVPAASVHEALSSDLPAAVRAAADRVESIHGRSVAGSKLVATLGLQYSYVGVLDLGDLAQAKDPQLVDQTVAAWVLQTYRADTSQVTIRWRPIRGTRRALVSCIRTEAVDALAAFARDRGLRFTSCQPALHGALEAHAAGFSRQDGTTLVWTEAHESAGRSPLVQLNCFNKGTLVSTWRGWVPDGEAGLAGALSRFRLFNGLAPGAQVRRELWLSAGKPTRENASV